MTTARLTTPRPRVLVLDRQLLGVLAGRGLLYLVGIALVVIFCFPLFWTVSGSFKTIDQLYLLPPVWWPRVLVWQNYARVWQVSPYWLFYQNTIIVSLSSALAQVTSASLVAYGFARFRFPGRAFLFMLALSTLMLPPELTMVPQFLLFKQLSWLDTWLPLIVPNFFGGGAFFIFLFRQFFLTIPFDLDEAATIDGANALRIFWSILAPLCIPAWAAAAIISILGHWNDFINPLIYLNTDSKYTLSLGLAFFRTGGVGSVPSGEPRDNLLMAASVMMTLPIIVLFLFLQRYFVAGIVMTGIKG